MKLAGEIAGYVSAALFFSFALAIIVGRFIRVGSHTVGEVLNPPAHQRGPRDGDTLRTGQVADMGSVAGRGVAHTHSNRSLRSRNHG